MISNTPRRKIHFTLVIAIVAGVLLLGYLGSSYRLQEPAPEPLKLRLALSASPHAAMPHLAVAQGYFIKESLTVEIIPATHGRDALNLVLEGKADLASVADVPIAIAVLKGETLGTVAGIANFSNENSIVARRDRGINAPTDLRNKSIAVPFGTSAEYFLWAYLIRHRIAPGLVTLVNIPPGQIVQALNKGAADAVAVWPPLSIDAQTALGDNAIIFKGNDVYTGTFNIVGRKAFLAQHPKAMEQFVRALLRAEEFNRSKPEQALVKLAKQMNVDIRILQQTWKEFGFRIGLRQSQLITLENQSIWAMERGHAEKREIPSFLPNFYLDALLAVNPERVSIVR
jgi:NitT/TauT family transport system substrate-binding protein